MKISLESWHYKLITSRIFGVPAFNEYDVSHNLCRYFWQVIGVMIAILCGIVLSVIPLGLIMYPLAGLAAWIITGVYVPDDTLLFGVFLLCLLIIGCFFVLSYKIFTYVVDSRSYNHGLFSSYVKAKAKKICPIIEFTQ